MPGVPDYGSLQNPGRAQDRETRARGGSRGRSRSLSEVNAHGGCRRYGDRRRCPPGATACERDGDARPLGVAGFARDAKRKGAHDRSPCHHERELHRAHSQSRRRAGAGIDFDRRRTALGAGAGGGKHGAHRAHPKGSETREWAGNSQLPVGKERAREKGYQQSAGRRFNLEFRVMNPFHESDPIVRFSSWYAAMAACRLISPFVQAQETAVPPVAGLPAAAHSAAASIDSEKIRAHVRFLSLDLLEGRGPGTRGDRLAAEYIATQFALEGVEAAGENNTYFQRVPLYAVHTVEDRTRFSFVPSNGGQP